LENKNKIEVKIHGKEYVLKGIESDAYMQRVSLYIDKKMNEVAKTDHRLSTAMVAVLVAINVADDYFKSIDQYETLIREFGIKSEEMDKTKASLKSALEEVAVLREKLTEQQFELVRTKTELKDIMTSYHRIN
jgi:cell division protein ZapA